MHHCHNDHGSHPHGRHRRGRDEEQDIEGWFWMGRHRRGGRFGSSRGGFAGGGFAGGPGFDDEGFRRGRKLGSADLQLLLLHLLARREPPTVVFPAVRYLITTTREHQRRLKLQHLLLLLLRTLLIAALVLAAAGPMLPRSGVAGHTPSALVLVVDNSPSSGAVVAGTARLAQIQAAARQVLARATPDDALWLIAADGVPRRGDRQTLLDQVATLPVSSRRLDLGAALGVAGDVLRSETRPGEITLLTDLQASAVSPAEVDVPLVVGRPDVPPPANVGIARLETGPQPWGSDGGRLTISLVGDSGGGTPVSARLGTRPPC